MDSAGYTETLPELVSMALAPLRSFGLAMEATMEDDAKAHLYDVGVVTSALVDYAERRLAEALEVVEAKVGTVSVNLDGHTSSIADRVVDAELQPAGEVSGGDSGKAEEVPVEGERATDAGQAQA